MICQRSGQCCVSMLVVIPVWTEEGVRAVMKPGGRPCPHLSYEGSQATCGVHDKPEYIGSPCWIYGNSDVDPDFIVKRGRPCAVGSVIQRQGGLPIWNPESLSKPMSPAEFEDLGPWPEGSD